MTHSFDLKAYFNRIGFRNNVTTQLTTLRELHILHTQAIPFENLNPLLKIPVRLDINSLQKKLIDQKRGGYCFEQNLLFQKVLETIGFDVTSLSGRVLLNKHEDTLTPKTHMLLLVQIKQQNYIVDVGFGGTSPCEPILLEPDLVQVTSHGDYRILEREDFYLLQVNIQSRWVNLYRFTTQETPKLDYKIANWYASTHPDSHFTKKLTIALAGEDCRYVFNNNHFKTYYQNGEVEKKLLSSTMDILQVLEDIFGLQTSYIQNIEKELSKILSIKVKQIEDQVEK